MRKNFFKRCIASLLLFTILCGVLDPTVVFAGVSKSHNGKTIENFSISNFGTARVYDVYYFYPPGSNAANEADKEAERVVKLTLDGGKEETVGTADFSKLYGNSYLTWDSANIFVSKLLKDDYFQTQVLNNIGNTYKVDSDFSVMADTLSESSQGASSVASLANLNQRMALFLYVRLNAREFVDADGKFASWTNLMSTDAAYLDMVQSTLDLGHTTSFGTTLRSIGIAEESTNSNVEKYGKSLSTAYPYSLNNVGVLGIDILDTYGYTNYNYRDMEVYAINDYCIYICLTEFANFYLKTMPAITSKENWYTIQSYKDQLILIKAFAEAYGNYIPCVKEIYTMSNENADNMSLKDMVEKADVQNASPEGITLDGFAEGDYTPHTDSSSPIGQFYTINSSIGIVDYDRDDILADKEVDNTLDMKLEQLKEEQSLGESITLEDMYYEDNVFNVSEEDLAESEDTINDLNESNKDSWDEIIGKVSVTDEGIATSYNAVTINKNIIEGMGYSATYIPMRTNLYSTDTISQYKGNEEFYEFFLKYGFMRKALLIDTSGTAAVDYYTAGGKFTGSTRVCTLRDLMEAGDKDVVLYLDSNFYNASDAIDTANNLQKSVISVREKIYNALRDFEPLYRSTSLFMQITALLHTIDSADVKDAVMLSVDDEDSDETKLTFNSTEFKDNFVDIMDKRYDFNVNKLLTGTTVSSSNSIMEYCNSLSYALDMSKSVSLTNAVLKTGDYSMYSDETRALLADIDFSDFVNLEDTNKADGNDNFIEDDNIDTVVLTSQQINKYMMMETTYSETEIDEENNTTTTNTYNKINTYSPMVSLAYVSCLYRDADTYTLAGTVEHNNPVFIASDELCSIKEANQWYRNSLLNYMLLRNLEGNAQVDYYYVIDLDCPVYMDVFGNIITESGTVVIPAAANATLHTGSYSTYNYAMALYSCYGTEYYVSTDLKGAYSVLHPYFVADNNMDSFVPNAITVEVNSNSVRLDKLNQYDLEVQLAVVDAYKAKLTRNNGACTRLNWMAMVKICNEVMRGAPIENIDKESENLVSTFGAKSGAVAAAKLEALLSSLEGQMSNTLIAIPDFTRTDNLEYWVALLLKLMMVATVGVVIVGVYRDGVAGKLGIRTFYKSLTSIALAVSCIVVIPSVFQLTYYSANKFLLGDEVSRILLVNEEKRQCGIEIGMTDVSTVESSDDFSLQLDWITVPWYEQIETMLYESTLDNLQKTKLEAYRQSEIYSNTDVDLYNDGVYISTDTLFDSVSIDYTFNMTNAGTRGLYLYANDSQQTAGFYSPYYVFLRILTANVNEYNQWRGNVGDDVHSYEEAVALRADNAHINIECNSYTTKYVSGNRLKTVGLSYNYFMSENFLYHDNDIMRLYQIYGAIDGDDDAVKETFNEKEATSFDRALLFSDEHIKQFRTSMWYNDLQETELDERIALMDEYAREFVSNNKDLLTKVTDETFIKVMALHLAVKYNQLFGITSANAIEIYNLDSTDLIRLCIINGEDAVMGSPMSYSRFVYNFGGEAAVYVAAVLSVIMWLGSFIKPLCTVIVFISVFMSVWVFRVCLQRPSANLWGYLCTVGLLCATNILHALILKLGVLLPNWGLPPLGCLIFLTLGQVAYLLVLSYVTGVALKDWSNLGAAEYEKEARLLSSKFRNADINDKLNGAVPQHEDNWEYYRDLVNQHRSRNR